MSSSAAVFARCIALRILAPDNVALLSFLGEHFYKTGKTGKARSYLSRAYEIEPGDERFSYCLVLTCADEGDAERAKDLLQSMQARSVVLPLPHILVWVGFLSLKDDGMKQLREFKLALASKVSPEAHYALGCLYYQLSRDSLAASHLRKAVGLDDGYSEAWHLLGLVCERGGPEALAQEVFRKGRNG